MVPKLIVHGGAWSIPEEYVDDHLNGVYNAVKAAYPELLNGCSAVDAVEIAVKIMEEDPTFDAGRGAFLNAIGEIELDAMIMDGKTLDYGAVAAIQDIMHPVSVARKVMEETEHCMIVGKGAQDFAWSKGFRKLAPQELLTQRELEYFHKTQSDPYFRPEKPFEPHPKDTVGAVALDCKGNLAAATSTGGTPRKIPGRVGDSPFIGAGAYADNDYGAASATGWGESIMKVLLSKTACDLLDKKSAQMAAQIAVDFLDSRVKGWGGLVMIKNNGEYGYAYNTEKMAFAYADDSGSIVAKIKV